MRTRKYPVELRERAVRLYRESDPKPVIRRLAEQLNVHPEALRNWIRQAEADAGERDDRPTTAMIEENRRLVAENRELRRVNEVLRAASAYFASEIDPTRRAVMSFVDAHDFSVDLVLRVLGIPASTYYDWRARQAEPSRRAREDAELLAMIDAIRGEHEFAATYGSPRVWLELRNRGVKVGRKRVERIMRVNGRQGAYLRKGWKHGSTRQNPRHTAAPDLLGRDFTATAPNQKWVADLTRILTGEGILWLASVRDAFANKVVGWDSGPRATTELVLSALDYAIWSRDVRDGQLIHHSDYAEVCVKPRICRDGLRSWGLLVDFSA